MNEHLYLIRVVVALHFIFAFLRTYMSLPYSDTSEIAIWLKGTNIHIYCVCSADIYCNRAVLLDEENTLLRRTKMQITCKCIRPPVCDTKRTDYYDLLYVFAHFVYGNYREHVELRNGTNYICTLWIHICLGFNLMKSNWFYIKCRKIV